MRPHRLLLPACLFGSLMCSAQGTGCANALAIAPGDHTADGPADGAGASQGDAVHADWYSYTPPVDGYLAVWSCGAGTDTRVHVHAGACGSLNLIASDDDGCPTGDVDGASLRANISVLGGTTYFIEWDDRHSSAGFNWHLDLYACPIAVPSFTAANGAIIVDWPTVALGSTYTIEVGPPGFVQGTGSVQSGTVNSNVPPLTIDSLTENAAYDMYISINCGAGNTAPFIGPWPATAGGPPTNDDCETALPIACGTTVSGTTIGVAPDAPPECGTTITAPGVWYSFVGTGGTVLLSTCADPGYDTKLNVYTGVCDDLSCVAGNDDGPFGCFPGSEVIFASEAGVTYLVLVQGYNGDQGTFNLELSCPTCEAPTGITVSPADTLAYVYWTTGNGGSAFTIEFGAPGFTPGTGTVVTGTVGVDGPPATLPGLDADTEYELYIQEDCGGGDLSEVRGPVGFITLADPLAENAFCPGALPIACGGSVEGNTSQGVYAPGPWCSSANITSPGLWYTFTGDGSAVTLSTCGTASYDSKISVFSGDCNALTCAGGNDDGVGCTGNTSQVTVATQSGTTYLVLVHGYQEAVGDFTLSMTCAEPCAPQVANDDCTTAAPLIPQPVGACVPQTGTNVCAYTAVQPNPECDPFAPIQDVWYVLNTGPSTDHTITVATVTSGALDVALYSACGSGFIACYDPAQGPIVLNGLTSDTEYYVQVWNGGGVDAGTFTICDEAPVLQGVMDMSQSDDLRAWPVPTDGPLTVEGLSMGAQLVLMDAQGRVVLTQQVTSSTRQVLDVSGLDAGAYTLRQIGPQVRAVPVIIQ